jgi:hypothetical protein
MNTLNTTSSEFVETPAGIFTRNGNWYYVTSGLIRGISPELLAFKSLDELVSDAEIWVKSTDAVTVLVFILLIQMIPIPLALLTSIGVLYMWQLSKSALVGTYSTTVLKVLTNDGFILISAVASISYLGIQQQYYELFTALVFFMVFRFGWLRKLFDTFYQKRSGSITLNDRVMKMVVIKSAIQHRVEIPGLRSMEQQIIDAMTKHKNKKPKS